MTTTTTMKDGSGLYLVDVSHMTTLQLDQSGAQLGNIDKGQIYRGLPTQEFICKSRRRPYKDVNKH